MKRILPSIKTIVEETANAHELNIGASEQRRKYRRVVFCGTIHSNVQKRSNKRKNVLLHRPFNADLCIEGGLHVVTRRCYARGEAFPLHFLLSVCQGISFQYSICSAMFWVNYLMSTSEKFHDMRLLQYKSIKKPLKLN